MSVKVFVLGRPGSGKTTATQHILDLAELRNYAIFRVRDYDILYEMFQNDIKHGNFSRFRPTEYGGFDVLDKIMFDLALEQLEKNVREIPSSKREEIITIEFARDDYGQALSKFSPEFLQGAYICFIDSDLGTCIQRIHERVISPSKPDEHYVSDWIMRTYYYKDNWDYITYELKQKYGIFKEVKPLDNNGSLSDFLAKVGEFAEIIFLREFIDESSSR